MPVYLDDLEPGMEFTSVGRTVTEADIMTFAGVSGDYNLLHVNEPWVLENTPFRGRIAHGLLILAMQSGMRTEGLFGLEVIAYLEETRKFTAPTYPGDTIRVVTRVDEARKSASRPGMGVLRTTVEVRNQDDVVVQSGTDAMLIACRP
jgi:3-hydroxybutyryl-CoA dehydratase